MEVVFTTAMEMSSIHCLLGRNRFVRVYPCKQLVSHHRYEKNHGLPERSRPKCPYSATCYVRKIVIKSSRVHNLYGKNATCSVICQLNDIPDNKVHGANMGPIWGRQDPGGPHVGPMNLLSAIIYCQWYDIELYDYIVKLVR